MHKGSFADMLKHDVNNYFLLSLILMSKKGKSLQRSPLKFLTLLSFFQSVQLR